MATFRVITEQEKASIVEEFHGDLGVRGVLKKYKRDYRTINHLWKEHYTEKEFILRTSRLCKLHKVGEKNPMFGKTRDKHHNSVDKSMTNGYVTIWAPKWFTGKTDGNRCYEHTVVYCQDKGLTEVPKGCVIHHIDYSRTNNYKSNLIMLSIGDHLRLHNTKS